MHRWALGRLRGPRLGLFSYPKAVPLEALGHLDRVGLAAQVLQRADTLSGGEQQRVAVALRSRKATAVLSRAVCGRRSRCARRSTPTLAPESTAESCNVSAPRTHGRGLVTAVTCDYLPSGLLAAVLRTPTGLGSGRRFGRAGWLRDRPGGPARRAVAGLSCP